MKFIACVLATIACVGVFAGDTAWSVSLLPGYQFSSGIVESGFVGGVDASWAFSRHIALHFDATGFRGALTQEYRDFYGVLRFDTYKSPFWLLEVGPEFMWATGNIGEVYTQLNFGYTLGSMNGNYQEGYKLGNQTVTYRNGTTRLRNNRPTFGLAVGYRQALSKTFCLTFQATYHHINEMFLYPYTSVPLQENMHDYADVRLGITFKF